MAFSAHRRGRRFSPEITLLERRVMLTALVTCLGQDGHDLVGPDAAQGCDGIQDLHLRLTTLSGPVSGIAIQAPGDFQWATAPDAKGASLAEYFPSTSPLQGDLFINPQVKSDQALPGGTLPLGGSTGSLIRLANGVSLSVWIYYSGRSSPDTTTVAVSSLISPTDPMPAIATPGNVVGTFTVADLRQDGSGQDFETGFVHLVVTAPDGVSFQSATFNQVFWGLSDQAGLAWDSTGATLGHNHIYATPRPDGARVADLYFAPQRNEAPAAGSTAPTMLLRVGIPGDSNVYVTAFRGTDWDPRARTNAIASQARPSAAPATESELRALLMSTNPEYDTIDLPANSTILITQPLEITHSVKINGQGATLLFDQGNTAPWSSTASGAIYVDAPAYTNIQLELTDFTIKFDPSSPIRWANPAGAGPALYDPENNPAGISHAVLDTRDSNTNLNMTLLTLSSMTIEGPPAFDGASFSSRRAQLLQAGDTAHQYVGEQDLDVVRTNDGDVGTIAGSTFDGGSIVLFGGPWKIIDNTVLGSTAGTFSPGAFALYSPHDVLVEGNQVVQSDPLGREFRLVELAVSGFNNLIDANSFGGGAGQIGNEVGYSAFTGQFGGLNDPEVILAESTYGVLFEGRPGAISGDGRLLILPHLRAAAYPGFTGPGLVVSILAGVVASGAPDMTTAGQWFRVAQQVSLTDQGTIELLMQDPLLPTPAGGYYVVEVTGGFVNNSFTDNQLDMTGSSSTGIVLAGEDYATRIVGNHFVGGTIYNNVYTGAAVSLGAAIGSAPGGSTAFPLPAGWTALPNLGAVIEDNVIDNSLGGIIIGVQHAVNYWEAQIGSTSETGRVFLTAAVTSNTFNYDSSFLTSWAASSAAEGNNPAQNSMPPTVTIGSGFSAEPPGSHGSPRFPWTVGNAITVNGNFAPIFVDPIENVVTIQGNSTRKIAPDGTITASAGPSGQVYAGVVNGAVDFPRIPPQTYNNQPYFPFNLNNLDTTSAGSASDGIQAIMAGQDGMDLAGPASGTPAPDGIQDLHLVLTGLDPSAMVKTVEAIGSAAGEDWRIPAIGSSLQMVLQRSEGSSAADLYLEPAVSHFADSFTIKLTYAQGGTITIPVAGVHFQPRLPILPAILPVNPLPPPVVPPPPPTAPVPTPPTNLSAGLASRNAIRLSWGGASGASYYIVERSSGGSTWSTVAADVAATDYLDSGLAFLTTYYYRVIAASSAGNSAPSTIASAQTQAQGDVLSAQALVLTLARKSLFSGVVAIFSDANAATGAARFLATINWGDGTISPGIVTGANGTFEISGSHRYARLGVFTIQITVSMSFPQPASTSSFGSVRVVKSVKRRPVVRLSTAHHPPAKSRRPPTQRAR
jgi:hypothetical protein